MGILYQKKVGLLFNKKAKNLLFKLTDDKIYTKLDKSYDFLRKKHFEISKGDGSYIFNAFEHIENDVREYYGQELVKERLSSSLMMRKLDFNCFDSQGFPMDISFLDAFTMLDDGDYLISTPAQIQMNVQNRENLISILELDGVVPSLTISPVSYAFDYCSYYYEKDKATVDIMKKDEKAFPYPAIDMMNIRKDLSQFDKNLPYTKSLPLIGAAMMPSIYYYIFCKHFNLLKNDVTPEIFYKLAQPSIVSGYL